MNKFSVIIPCHNPDLDQLRRLLLSVRSQLKEIEGHEILVLDDCSENSWNISFACECLGASYVRQDKDLGGCKTTNEGMRRAANELVHAIHPDDWVLDGFYETVSSMADKKHCALYATRHLLAHSNGTVFKTSSDVVPERLPLHEGNPLEVPACVVRKSFVEKHGGWNESLIHTADWEHHVRAAHYGGIAVASWPLAVHTVGSGTHTERLAKEGDNLRDHLRMADVVKEYACHLVHGPKFRAWIASRARHQEKLFRERRDFHAAEANAMLARELESTLPPHMVKE